MESLKSKCLETPVPLGAQESHLISPKKRIEDLKRYSLLYVGTPYSKYPWGIQVAFEEASRLTAGLMQRGLRVYSPIAHTHPLAIYGQIDPLDHEIWLPFDRTMMEKADAMIVLMMDSWEASKGISHECDFFIEAHKPIYYLDPKDLEIILEDDGRDD